MWREKCLAVAILILAMGTQGWPQNAHPIFPTPPAAADSTQTRQNTKSPDLEKLRIAAEQQKMQVQKDTNRLNQLVTELKQAVDHAPAGTVSMEALKKTQEIEKLAKRLNKELRGE
jgi:anti-sigma28 factor (negative regulator of flagellin synthesis)